MNAAMLFPAASCGNGVSRVLSHGCGCGNGATFIASIGKFSQAPDYQYLVDAAFDDTTRTGRSRVGNPGLGFESSTQYEFSLRLRPVRFVSVRANVYVRRLDGLVASVPLSTDPDSSIFGRKLRITT